MTAGKHKAMPITVRNPLPASQQDEDASTFTKTFCRKFAQNICTKHLDTHWTNCYFLLLPKYAQLPLPDDAVIEERWEMVRVVKGETFRMVGSRFYLQPKNFSLKFNNMEWLCFHCTFFMLSRSIFCFSDLLNNVESTLNNLSLNLELQVQKISGRGNATTAIKV